MCYRVTFFEDEPRLGADVVAQYHAAKEITFGEPDFREAGSGRRNLRDKSGTVALGEPIAAAEEAFRASDSGSAAIPAGVLHRRLIRWQGGQRSQRQSSSVVAASAQAVAGDGFELAEFDGL